MISVDIIQGTLPSYRIPLFNSLGASPLIKLRILHSGERKSESAKHFEEVVVQKYQFMSIVWQSKISELTKATDVVIGMFDLHWLPAGILSIYRTAYSNQRRIYWGHGYGRSHLGNQIRDFLARRSDALIVYNDASKRRLIKQGHPEHKIFVAHNSISVPNARFSRNTTRTQLLYIGRLQKRKKLDQLFVAFASIAKEIPRQIGITVVGDGDIKDELQSLAKNLGIHGRVQFFSGTFDASTIKAHFDQAIAYVSPDAVGLGVLHSFAYGVPVITNKEGTHGPEFDNLIHLHNAYLFSGDTTALANAILEINQLNLTEMRQNCYEFYVKERSISQMAESIQKAIVSQIADRKTL